MSVRYFREHLKEAIERDLDDLIEKVEGYVAEVEDERWSEYYKERERKFMRRLMKARRKWKEPLQ